MKTMQEEASEQRRTEPCNSGRRGDWFSSYTGLRIYPFDPSADQIRLIDIAHALSNVCRFGGHSRCFYSVAQHSVLVAQNLPVDLAAVGLLHDATEAYLGDVVRPLKHHPEMNAYRNAETAWSIQIGAAFNLGTQLCCLPSEVKRMDNVLLSTERRDLILAKDRWKVSEMFEPLPGAIEPITPVAARGLFLEECERLGIRHE